MILDRPLELAILLLCFYPLLSYLLQMLGKVFVLFLSALVMPVQFSISILGLVEQVDKLIVLLMRLHCDFDNAIHELEYFLHLIFYLP